MEYKTFRKINCKQIKKISKNTIANCKTFPKRPENNNNRPRALWFYQWFCPSFGLKPEVASRRIVVLFPTFPECSARDHSIIPHHCSSHNWKPLWYSPTGSQNVPLKCSPSTVLAGKITWPRLIAWKCYIWNRRHRPRWYQHIDAKPPNSFPSYSFYLKQISPFTKYFCVEFHFSWSFVSRMHSSGGGMRCFSSWWGDIWQQALARPLLVRDRCV